MTETSTITREGEMSSAEHPWPSSERAFWETAREIPHIEAREAAKRLVNSHFHNPDSARVSIPANPDHDDDLVLHAYIRQQARKAISGEAAALDRATLREQIRRHGGEFHGPRVEHLSIEERAFWRFLDEVIATAAGLSTGGARG